MKTVKLLLLIRHGKVFAIENNAEVNVCEGANYLQVCDGAEGEFAEEAKVFASGIRSVMKGEKESFYLEYFL